MPGEVRTGAVCVYRYYDEYRAFGDDVEFSANGVSMIVGEHGESSDAEGIAGDWSNLRAAGSGAVWLY